MTDRRPPDTLIAVPRPRLLAEDATHPIPGPRGPSTRPEEVRPDAA
ncbi:hypothetical protein ORIO_10455 [Cereibacter azotoformans]|nr:hypothetical protein [Cereibacter azotoformans]ULB10319.1 hypothetical protein ORIO_10455 [Cereibacter azotoformans]